MSTLWITVFSDDVVFDNCEMVYDLREFIHGQLSKFSEVQMISIGRISASYACGENVSAKERRGHAQETPSNCSEQSTVHRVIAVQSC